MSLSFRLISAILVALLVFAGCNSSTLENATGSPNLSAMSVVHGVVGNTSLTFSKSKIDAAQKINASVQKAEGLVALDMALITETGVLLQRKTFAETDADGNTVFSFEGQFGEETRRLRIFEDGRTLEILLGKPQKNKDVMEVELKDFRKSALATRMLEQTKEYHNLKVSDFDSIKQKMETIIDTKLESEDVDKLLTNYDRLGIDEQGNFKVYPTNYNPKIKRGPTKTTVWEKALFNGDSLPSNPSSTLPANSQTSPLSTTQTTAVTNLHLSPQRNLVNWIIRSETTHPLTSAITVLYRQGDLTPFRPSRINTPVLPLRIVFKSNLPVEYQDYLLTRARYRMTQGSHLRKNGELLEFNPEFESPSVLLLKIPLKSLDLNSTDTLYFFMDENLPDLFPLELSQIFLRIGLVVEL